MQNAASGPRESSFYEVGCMDGEQAFAIVRPGTFRLRVDPV